MKSARKLMPILIPNLRFILRGITNVKIGSPKGRLIISFSKIFLFFETESKCPPFEKRVFSSLSMHILIAKSNFTSLEINIQ